MIFDVVDDSFHQVNLEPSKGDNWIHNSQAFCESNRQECLWRGMQQYSNDVAKSRLSFNDMGLGTYRDFCRAFLVPFTPRVFLETNSRLLNLETRFLQRLQQYKASSIYLQERFHWLHSLLLARLITYYESAIFTGVLWSSLEMAVLKSTFSKSTSLPEGSALLKCGFQRIQSSSRMIQQDLPWFQWLMLANFLAYLCRPLVNPWHVPACCTCLSSVECNVKEIYFWYVFLLMDILYSVVPQNCKQDGQGD